MLNFAYLFIRKMFGKSVQNLQVEVAGLVFQTPVGIPYTIKRRRCKWFQRRPNAGFLLLTPPKDNILPWIKELKSEPENSILAVDIKTDILRTFSLVYDFADFIIIDPDSDLGIDASDISDTQSILDELVSLRLCYENYTPVFLSIAHDTNDEELKALLSACQMNGLDGVVVRGLDMLDQVAQITLGRVPVICQVSTPEEGIKALEQGALLLQITNCKALNKLLKSIEDKQVI